MSRGRGILILDLSDLTSGLPPLTYSTLATMACLLRPVSQAHATLGPLNAPSFGIFHLLREVSLTTI